MKAFSRLLIAAIGAAAFASCTQNGSLIYTNIQKTQKTNTSTTIPLDITVSDIANVASGTSPYYVAAGKVYNGTIPTGGITNWSSIPVPTSPSGVTMLCNSLTYDSGGNLLYGGFFDGTGSGYFGLYTMTPGVNSWTQIPDPLITDAGKNDKQVTYVNAINGDVFVVAATMPSGASSYVYELDLLHVGAWSQLIAPGTISRPITGIGFDGTKYYFTSANSLYVSSGAVPTLSFSGGPINAIDGTNSSGDFLQGVFADTDYLNTGTNTIIIVPASNPQVNPPIGNLYYSTDSGSTWTRLSQRVGSYDVGFLCVSQALDAGHTTYLLGTDSGTGGAFGFFAFVPGSNLLSRFGGLSYSLYYSAVRRILVDPVNSVVAMGTINNGLWATTPLDPSGGFSSNTWTQE